MITTQNFIHNHVAWILGGFMAGVCASALALYRKWNRFQIEHEILIGDYCDRRNIEREDLPTRHK